MNPELGRFSEVLPYFCGSFLILNGIFVLVIGQLRLYSGGFLVEKG